MEKRLPIAMVVNLASVRPPNGIETELTYTDNLSAHGACVVSNHAWKPGEMAEVTSLLDKVSLRGKVIYCRKRAEEQYAIGLSFQSSGVAWTAYLKYAGLV